MLHSKLMLAMVCVLVLGLGIACAPSVAPANRPALTQPTTDAMMAQETDTAMKAKETEAVMMAKPTGAAMAARPTDAASSGDAMTRRVPPQQFAAHFVDSMPVHQAMLTELPERLTLNFNFTLSPASTITLERDGKELQTAPGKLSDNELAMTADLPVGAGMRLCLFKYNACWPDNSCHSGQFTFCVK